MTENKTPDSDLDRFEKFLNSMSEEEFDDWLQNPDVSEKQKAFADTIRESSEEGDADIFDTGRRDALRRFRGF
jgi:hypothetical protein